MRMKISRHSIELYTDDARDVAFLEDALGITPEKPQAVARRINIPGTSQMMGLEIVKNER